MFTHLDRPEYILNSVVDTISAELDMHFEEVERLLFIQHNPLMQVIFWGILHEFYPECPFKEIKYCSDCNSFQLE